MLWEKVMRHNLENLAMMRRDTELTLKIPREEIDEFIVEQFRELMEKYNHMDRETLNAEYVRVGEESKELIAQELKELLGGADL